MKPFTSSIRRHLLSWLLIPITTLCFIGAGVTYGLAVDFATDAYDDALLDCAHSVANRLIYKSSELTVDMPPAARAILKHGDKDNTYYQIVSPEGKVINGDVYIPDPPRGEDFSEEPYFYDGFIEGFPVRIGIIEVARAGSKQRIVIKVAETVTGRTQLTQSIFLGVLIPQLILIVLAALAVWLGVSRGLLPLGRLKEAVESRNPADLRPLSEQNVPKEVKPLVLSINKLLLRLQEDRDLQKRFLSNAAHQLRTPLAGLKTQTELALRQKDQSEIKESLQHINTSASRATRLAQQLLALARVEPAVFDNLAKEALDLNKIAKDASKELVLQAIAKKIDLGFEGNDDDVQLIAGDRASLYEMLFNLIENAVFYTEAGGSVTVRVSQNEKGPIFSVEDNGPGIPETEREHVFERFYRILGNKQSGSGLGLAIVREIAEIHEASVELKSGPDNKGTVVEVQFKRMNFDAAARISAAAAFPAQSKSRV
ncbi:MAG: sensor histidine kinase N-terminal domain-containing protein [Candidatus Obscuribacterales bacterium]|nr:sensor histidine kinase N-terminal domain-containing protein [Candidatus Obscuribacterales bacterium]